MSLDVPMTDGLELRVLSSLSKVFADAELADRPIEQGSALAGEVYSFQIAYRSPTALRGVRVGLESALAPYTTLRKVGLAPSELPAFEKRDVHYLRTTPGLYPDVLEPLDGELAILPAQWRSLWVQIAIPADASALPHGPDAASTYPLTLSFIDESGETLGAAAFTLEVVPVSLPAQRLIHTCWFHCDCIATQYGVEVFSEEHWRLIGIYARNAAEHSVNMLLTPLFTPPLDTAVGGERPTVQLIGVEEAGAGQYRFDFSRLVRWIEMCREAGIEYLEFSHLFTQWGAGHAPKIVAGSGPSERRLFGWDTDAASDAYRSFLDQFLPQLAAFIKAHQLQDRVYFHVSDEPHLDHLESYRTASEMLKQHLSEFRFFEALSNYEFYESGLVPIPVPASDHIGPFLEHNVEPRWTYYCCGQGVDVANRFFSMPSARNRILGMQLFQFEVSGFLHWGYNFWYTQHSLRQIDPFRVTDAGGAFPSGDSFVVYPGQEGPLDSLRWEVFREGIQDLRALELLASLTGRERALEIMLEDWEGELRFDDYPRDLEWLIGARERINQAIKQAAHGLVMR